MNVLDVAKSNCLIDNSVTTPSQGYIIMIDMIVSHFQQQTK